MNKIIQLPQEVISKIAAGEVIERPAYAVKELLENAIDARADYIRIDIEKSGLQKIMVTDNGEGMSKEDLQLAFLPHTTSKLHSEQDLHNIKYMGFRGEALASIAAISRLTIKSRNKDEVAGTNIEIEEGKIANLAPIGMSTGTTVIVENLFSSIPARKKFLRSLQTEFRTIMQIIVSLALAQSQIHFFVTNNQHTVLDLPKQSLTDRLTTILGKNTTNYLIPVSSHESYLKISGFISKPQLSQTTQNKNFLFVNNRVIRDARIKEIIRQAYGTLLPPQVNPIYIIFINLPYEMIDVNVHPRKEEIHFHNLQLIHESLDRSFSEALQAHNLTFQDKRWKKTNNKNELLENFTVREGNTSTFAADLLRDQIQPLTIKPESFQLDNMLQINNLYILTQTKSGIVLVDQHAAHERILYEQLTKNFQREKRLIQQYELKQPLLLDFGTVEKNIIDENEQLFRDHGFEITHFAGNSYKIIAVPKLFKDRDIEELLREMIEDIAEYNRPKDIDIRSQRMLTYIACRSAVKAGESLTHDQMRDIVNNLQQTPHNETCPHGRPTQIVMTFKDLNTLFHR